MPPTLGDRLIHILDAIKNIQVFLAGKTIESLAEDLPLRLAVERLFEIISEASRRVPAEIKARETQIDWQGMADLGNLLRHAYHRVEVSRLLKMTEIDLPPLKAFVERIVSEEKKH